jgi:hypothetical protein
MHGDIVVNKTAGDCGVFFFVLNPCLPSTKSLEGDEGDVVLYHAVVQNMESKHDFRYVNLSYFESGLWYVYDNKIKELKE